MALRAITCREGMRFGMGVDSQTETACGEALQYERIEAGDGGQRVRADFLKIESQEQLMESMDISVSASVSYGLSSVDAKFDFSRQHSVNDYTVYLLLKASVHNPPRHMVAPKLTDEAAAIYKRAPDEFRQTFGDMYIDEIYSGGEFFGLLMFHTHDESSKTSIVAELDMSVGSALAGGSIQATFKSSIEALSKKSSLQITAIMSGGAGLLNPRDIGELDELYHSFNKSVLEHPIDFTVALKEFKYLPLPAGPLWVEQLVRGTTIEGCGRNVVDAIKQKGRLDYILSYPNEFAPFDAAALKAARTEVDALIPKWAQRAQACASDVSKCSLEGLDPVSITLPTRLVTADPLGAKWELVKQHDSRARDYFLESFISGHPFSEYDEHNGGRYKIFYDGQLAKGGIFWHPKVADGQACVVYGSIFQEYIHQGHCEGPLGFPTTDEETLSGYKQDGLDRISHFENGLLWWDAGTGQVHATDPDKVPAAVRVSALPRFSAQG
jgi:hypothetical protein